MRAIIISIDGFAGFYWNDPRARMHTLARLAERGAVYVGTHGQRPDHGDNLAFCLAAAPGISRGISLGAITSRDVAPTLAHILGVRMINVEGRRLDEILA